MNYSDLFPTTVEDMADLVASLDSLDKLALLEILVKQRRRALEQKAIDQAGKLLAEAA